MSQSLPAEAAAGLAPAEPVLDDGTGDVLCDPYLAALAMHKRHEPALPPSGRRAAKGKSPRKKGARAKAGTRTRKTPGIKSVARKPRQPARRRAGGAEDIPAISAAIPLPPTPEPLAAPETAPPWQGEATPLPRHRSVAPIHSQGLLAQILGWLGESLRPAAPRSRRGLSPSSLSEQAREIERLKAENAALHRQVEALLALRETERREPAATDRMGER